MLIPLAFERVPDWSDRRRAGHLLIALDFDGTIAPIVRRPQDAVMLAPARAAIEKLLQRHDTDVAIVSGRALADLRDRCDLAGVYYAGNHGLQIEGPGVHETRPDALRLIPRIRAIRQALERELNGISGVYLEDKEMTLSVHTRMIDDDDERERVHDIVRRAHGDEPEGLRLTYGKRVIEVRPDTDWHKGEATLFLIERISRARGARLFPIFIGDDVTDEDAFASLRSIGAGVLVSKREPTETAASAWVRSPDDVVQLLERLA